MTELPAHEALAEPTDPWWKLRAGWIYSSIAAGHLRDHDAKEDTGYSVRLMKIGALSLPEGRLVAADPYLMGAEPEPFIQLLNADTAEVMAARAVIGEGHERIAALILKVGSTPVADWTMATVAGQDVMTLNAEGFFGYAVDAGTGSFGGPEAMRIAGRVLMEDAGMLEDPLSRALLGDGIGTQSATVVAPEPGSIPIAVCSSGWGDGCYPTWLGIDSSGDMVVAVTDFLLTGDPYAAPLARAPTADVHPPPQPKRLFRRLFGR